MAHMGCECGHDMWDGDGHIVYDIFSKKDLTEYIKESKSKYRFEDMYDECPSFYEDNSYFWLCDKCKRVHMWSYLPKYCTRTFKLSDKIDRIDLDYVKKLEEYYVVNLYDYDVIDSEYICDFIKKNPIRPYKYYVKEDLTKIYIVNTDIDEIDKVYELTHESFVEYNLKSESFDNLLIYTIDKTNDGHEYEVKDGKKIQIDSDDYPHKQVNFMITEKGSNNGSISYADPNQEPEIYNINTMDKFNEKYGKYFEKNKKSDCNK